MQVLASQLHFLANRNAGLAIPPLFWPVNCIKIGGHVALLSGPTVDSLYCGSGNKYSFHHVATDDIHKIDNGYALVIHNYTAKNATSLLQDVDFTGLVTTC